MFRPLLLLKVFAFLFLLMLVNSFEQAVAQAPVIDVDARNTHVCQGKFTFFEVFSSNATSNTWQVSTDGGNNWSTVIDNTLYSGSSSPFLNIIGDISLNHNKYRGIVSNTSGSTISSVATLYVDTSLPKQPVFVNPVTSLCLGTSQLFSVTGFTEGDTLRWKAYRGEHVYQNNYYYSDSFAVYNFYNVGSHNITVFVGNGCGYGDPGNITVTINPLSIPAGNPGGSSSCSENTVFQGAPTIYADGTCGIISAVTPSGANPVKGTVQNCVTVDAAPLSYNGIPYVPRHYNIEPATNAASATATLTLYFTQADFDAYNAVRGTNPALPTGSSDATGISNIRITQFHGAGTTPGTYAGGSGEITPSPGNVIWNATASHWEITFDITGFSGFFVSGGSLIPLPLNLISFEGKATRNGNLLSWTTSSEQNTLSFEIQRSPIIDGTVAGNVAGSGFQVLHTVPAAGNSNQNLAYQYTDAHSPADGGSYAYRLKMVDLDGKFSYSKIVVMQAPSDVLFIKMAPNPFHDPLAITIQSPQAANARITVTDVSGRQMLAQSLFLKKGLNRPDPVTIGKFSQLPTGMYLLTVSTDRQNQTIRFIKE